MISIVVSCCACYALGDETSSRLDCDTEGDDCGSRGERSNHPVKCERCQEGNRRLLLAYH